MSANLWGAFRIRKTDGLVMIRCEQCGQPVYYDPDRDFIITAARYTSKATGAEYVRPFLFFSKCTHCNSNVPNQRKPQTRVFAKQQNRGQEDERKGTPANKADQQTA